MHTKLQSLSLKRYPIFAFSWCLPISRCLANYIDCQAELNHFGIEWLSNEQKNALLSHTQHLNLFFSACIFKMSTQNAIIYNMHRPTFALKFMHIKRFRSGFICTPAQNLFMWDAKLHLTWMVWCARICESSSFFYRWMRRMEKPWNGKKGEREKLIEKKKDSHAAGCASIM